jgi:hypothetical protein
MKKIIYCLFCLCVLAGCKSKLDEVSFSDNPYDSDYSGEEVVILDSVSRVRVTTTVYVNRVTITSKIQMYQKVVLYRNGVVIKTENRSGYTGEFIEQVDDYTAIPGSTYTYTAALKHEEAFTRKSNSVTFTTP